MTESLSLNCYKRILTSDWFYPSNCELRPLESKGSITQTLTDHKIDLFARTTIHRNIFAKGLRALARAIAVCAIGIIVAPIDILRHGCYAIYYTFAEGITSAKVKKYAKSLFDDFKLFACVGICIAMSSMFCAFNILCLINFSSTNINEWFSSLVVTFLLGVLVSLLSRPSFSLDLFVDPDKLIPFYKSIVLRHDFGIVNNDGGLLPYDLNDDEPLHSLEGYLYNWMTQQKEELDRTYLASELHSWARAGGFNSYESLFLAKLSSPESLQDPNAQHLRKLYDQLSEIADFFVDCQDLKFPNLDKTKFRQGYKNRFDQIPDALPIQDSSQDSSWDTTIAQATECRKNSPLLSDKLPELAKMVNIIRKKGTPQELLDNPTVENLGAKYKIKTNIAHEDKLDPILKTIKADAATKAIILSQAKEVLACLREAKELVKKSFKSK